MRWIEEAKHTVYRVNREEGSLGVLYLGEYRIDNEEMGANHSEEEAEWHTLHLIVTEQKVACTSEATNETDNIDDCVSRLSIFSLRVRIGHHQHLASYSEEEGDELYLDRGYAS